MYPNMGWCVGARCSRYAVPDPKEAPEPGPAPEDDEHGAALAKTFRDIEREQPQKDGLEAGFG